LALSQDTVLQNVVAQIRTNADLVLVPVSVTDRRGTPIAGLTKNQFRVLEDKVPQAITTFIANDEPVSIGVVLDASGSMQKVLPTAKAILWQLLGAMNESDELFLITASSQPEMLAPFTGDLPELRSRLKEVRAGGRTALLDSVMLGLCRAASARNPRQALVIISDGNENYSRVTRPEVLRAAMESYTQIYTIVFPERPTNPRPILLPPENGADFLSDLSRRTGGLHFTIQSSTGAAGIAGKIARAIRHQYVIGYSPIGGSGSKWRKIRVKLELDDVRVSARAGYYAR
jgi:Ca-activated chloride channel homolog